MAGKTLTLTSLLLAQSVENMDASMCSWHIQCYRFSLYRPSSRTSIIMCRQAAAERFTSLIQRLEKQLSGAKRLKFSRII